MRLSYNDRIHGYYLDGARCKNVTNVAKIADDTFGLDMWRKRMVALGMARNPALAERAAAHHDDRDKLDEIAEEALTAANAFEKAQRGTAAHRIAERVDLGELVIDTPLSRAISEAWLRALKEAGLKIVPELIERIVCYPDRLIAGRFDRIVKVTKTGRYAVLDLKTGQHAIDYPHATAIQLALYANAPHMAGPLDSDGATEVFEELPERLDKKTAYVVHIPSDDKVDVVKFDIKAGWDAATNIVFPALDWRKNDKLVTPFVEQEVLTGPASAERLAWVRGRLAILAMVDGAKSMVARNWPQGIVPKTDWTDSECDAIVAVLDQVERHFEEAPFSTPDPILTNTKHQETSP